MATEVDITDSPSEDLLAVPAWYDPKKRRFIWDRGRTMRVGILIIGPDDLAYTTDEGVVFEAKLGQVQVHWSSSRFFHTLLPRCDLHTQQGDYRLWFSRPMPDAPRLRKDQITKITDALEYLEIAEFFGGALGTAAEVVPLIGDLAALSLELIDWRSGLRNSDAVRKRLIGNDADG